MDVKNCTSTNSELRKLERLGQFQLPNHFKKLGYWIVALTFGLMLAKGFVEEPLWVKPVLSNIMLFGLLIISLSKEKIEDEFIESLRSKSYRLAFILGTVYAMLVLPFVNYFMGWVLNKPESQNFEVSVFEVLFCMLIIQLLYFNKARRE